MSVKPNQPFMQEGDVQLTVRIVVDGQLRTVNYILHASSNHLVDIEDRLADRCRELYRAMVSEA